MLALSIQPGGADMSFMSAIAATRRYHKTMSVPPMLREGHVGGRLAVPSLVARKSTKVGQALPLRCSPEVDTTEGCDHMAGGIYRIRRVLSTDQGNAIFDP